MAKRCGWGVCVCLFFYYSAARRPLFGHMLLPAAAEPMENCVNKTDFGRRNCASRWDTVRACVRVLRVLCIWENRLFECMIEAFRERIRVEGAIVCESDSFE